jgi:hypothetical protein
VTQIDLDFKRDDGAPPTLADFDGVTYVSRLDRARLNSVLASVWRQLQTGRRFTLPELHAAVEADLGRSVLMTSVSAKARDLKKVAFGSHPIRSERVGESGTWLYWLEREGRSA